MISKYLKLLEENIKNIKNKREKPLPSIPLPIQEADQLLKTNDGYRIVLKITDSLNVDLLSSEEVTRAVDSIQRMLNSIEIGRHVQILISSEKVDIADYFHYLEEIEEEAEKSGNEYRARMAREKKNFLKDYTQKSRRIHNFYIVVSSPQETSDEAYEDLRNLSVMINDSLIQGQMGCKPISREEILQLIYQKLCPTLSNVQPFNEEMDIPDVFPFAIKDHGKYLELEDRYYSFFTFSRLPQVVKHSWLKPVLEARVELDLCISMTAVDKSQVIENTSKKIVGIEEKLAGRLTPALREKYENQKRSLERLLTRLSNEEEGVFDTSFILAISAESPDELARVERRLQSIIGSARIRSKKILFQGFDMLWYTIPVGYRKTELEKRISWPMHSRLIASILPFNSSELNFNTGVLKGVNRRTEAPIIYNRFDTTIFQNANETVLGPPGSGKSYYLRLDMLRQSEFGGVNRIICIDVEREYFFPDANRVVFRLGSEFTTNPFHIRSTILDNDQNEGFKDVGGYLRRKIGDMLSFFRWIIPDMSQLEINILLDSIQKCYEEYGLNLHDSFQALPSEFPTLSTLEKHLKCVGEDANRILQCLSPYVHGVFAPMFNGQTNWHMEAKKTILDIHELTDEVKSPLMDLLTKEIWEEVKKDRKEPKGFYCDESHFLVDRRNTHSQLLLWQLSKRIRKYNGYLTCATQSIIDFLSVGKYGSAILDSSYIKTFFSMGELDIQEISKFISFGFSERELEILSRRNSRGACIHMIGDKRMRVEMQTLAMPYEKKLLNLPS